MQVKDFPTFNALVCIDLAWRSGACWFDTATNLGIPFKVALRSGERLSNQRLIDYGTSLNYPWLTDTGRVYLSECLSQLTVSE